MDIQRDTQTDTDLLAEQLVVVAVSFGCYRLLGGSERLGNNSTLHPPCELNHNLELTNTKINA